MFDKLGNKVHENNPLSGHSVYTPKVLNLLKFLQFFFILGILMDILCLLVGLHKMQCSEENQSDTCWPDNKYNFMRQSTMVDIFWDFLTLLLLRRMTTAVNDSEYHNVDHGNKIFVFWNLLGMVVGIVLAINNGVPTPWGMGVLGTVFILSVGWYIQGWVKEHNIVEGEHDA